MNTRKYLKLIPAAALLLFGILSVKAQTKPGNASADVELWLKADAGVTTSGSNVTTWTDQSGKGRNYSAVAGAAVANIPIYNQTNNLMNYQPSIQMTAAVQKLVGPNHFLDASRSYYTFYVSEQSASLTTFATVYTFNASGTTARSNDIGWITGRPSFHIGATGTTYTYTHQGNGNLFGINAAIIPNKSGTGPQSYMNGVVNTAYSNTNNTRILNLGTGTGVVGNSYASATGNSLGFIGNIQEIIILSGNAGDYINSTDLVKVNSYLAIKYGIPLESGNYVNSDGIAIWDRDVPLNATYSSQILGIGRDDAYGLNQKQAENHALKDNGLRIFLGDGLKALNSQNSGAFTGDKQYVLIGCHTGDVAPILSLTNPEVVTEACGVTTQLNIQSSRYMAQLSGLSSINVKLVSPSKFFSYVLVSTNEDFNDASTFAVYPLVNGAAEVTLDANYKYIKFVGLAQGPGGVSDGLLLWLRADDANSIVTLPYDSANSELAGFSSLSSYDPKLIKNQRAIPVVDSWTDIMRDDQGSHTWTYAAGGTATSRRRPVFEPNVREMNYKPSIHFWSNVGGTISTWLANTSRFTDTNPATHTALFMMNNNFNAAARVYQMQVNGNTRPNGYLGPMYGIERNSNGTTGRGRYRGDEDLTSPTSTNLFTVGATTITSYYVTTGSSGSVRFRFNGNENTVSDGLTGTDLTRTGSVIGTGYGLDRTIQGYISEIIIYDRLIDQGANGLDNRNKIESYMALKYGITLRPSGSRLDYKFSNDMTIWGGLTGAAQFATFYNRIAAVLYDEAALQDNRHAISTDVGSLLHLGVAGTELSDDGSKLGVLNDLEAVAFGDDNRSGFTDVPTNADIPCSNLYDRRFNRLWLIHKVTNDDRPVRMLVGAQNNAQYSIGEDDNTKNYYSVLNPGYDVTMLVADSPSDTIGNNFKAVIPMSFINGEFQCSYEFTQEDTYITFGIKPSTRGCVQSDDITFSGIKTFPWTDWVRATNNNATTTTGLTIARGDGTSFPLPAGNLGDSIAVTKTTVSYPSGTYPTGVRATRGYPRTVNSPARGSLRVRRRGGQVGESGAVTIRIDFNTPVLPEFTISGLNRSGNALEDIVVTGECASGTFYPILSYASSSSAATYKLSGNRATVKAGSRSASATSVNGRVNVAFRGGVSSIVIKYRVAGAATRSIQDIYISPITLRTVSPPPPVNEDGLSFVKQVNKRDFLTCEPVRYSFEIQNVNCDNMLVNFSDSLPDYLKWVDDSFGLDAVSDSIRENLGLDFNPIIEQDGTKLRIDSLVVPGGSTLILTAMAEFDENTPDEDYENNALITYKQIVNNVETDKSLYSLDKETLDSLTVLSATYSETPQKVTMTDTYSKSTYKENDEIEVTYVIDNPNATAITDANMDIIFNEEFTYVANSMQFTWLEGTGTNPVLVTPSADEPGLLLLAGDANGDSGFTMPQGKLQIKFKVKAPTADNLIKDSPNDENATDLVIAYGVYSSMDDVCFIEAIAGLNGDRYIPYSLGKSYIITNQHITTKIVR